MCAIMHCTACVMYAEGASGHGLRHLMPHLQVG